MAITLQNLWDKVRVELQKDQSSPFAVLATGSGSNAYAYTTEQTITIFLNEGKDHFCRTAYLFPVSGTLAVTADGGPSYSLSSFTPDGSVKAINDVVLLTWTPLAGAQAFLTYMSYEAMVDQFQEDMAVPPAGVPSVWCSERGGFPSIRIPVITTTSGTLTIVDGYGLPVDFDFTDPDQLMDWIPDDRYEALVTYACAKLCRMNISDKNMVARYDEFCREYDRIRLHTRADIDPDLALKYLQPYNPIAPPTPGVPQGGGQDSDGDGQ